MEDMIKKAQKMIKRAKNQDDLNSARLLLAKAKAKNKKI